MKATQEFIKHLPELKNRTQIFDRGIFAGGQTYVGTIHNVIQYIDIKTLSNTTDFGDLSNSLRMIAGTSNSTNNKGVFGGGYTGSASVNSIETISITSTSNAQNFGDLTTNTYYLTSTSNGTNNRGIFAGGYAPTFSNIISYITLNNTSGNAQDFGDLTNFRGNTPGSCSNIENNRGIIFAGLQDGAVRLNSIEYITINSLSNGTDFGDTTTPTGTAYNSGLSNGTSNRGVLHEGFTTFALNILSYINISTPSNAQDFGDLTAARYGCGTCSSMEGNRGVFGGGYSGSNANTIDYITINSLGNATSFGSLTQSATYPAAFSNS